MKKSIKLGLMGLVFMGASTAFAFSTMVTQSSTYCTSGDTGICESVAEGGKGCRRINPEFIGDCGGTSKSELEVGG